MAIENQEYDNIDKYLHQASFDVQDDGFTDRVIQAIPKHAGWERRLQRIWQLFCLTTVLLIGWWTNALDIIMTDLHVFFNTLPINFTYEELFFISLLPIIVLLIGVIICNKKLIY